MTRNKISDGEKENGARTKYQVAVDKHIAESQYQWDRFSSMLVFNSILIAAITLSYQDNVGLPQYFNIFLPVAGLITCGLWYSMNLRAFGWMNHWIVSAREIERKYFRDTDPILNPVIDGNTYRQKNKCWLNAECATNILIGVITVLYTILLYSSLELNFSKRVTNRNYRGSIYSKYGNIKYHDRSFKNQYPRSLDYKD